jgi:hypothetical protein
VTGGGDELFGVEEKVFAPFESVSPPTLRVAPTLGPAPELGVATAPELALGVAPGEAGIAGAAVVGIGPGTSSTPLLSESIAPTNPSKWPLNAAATSPATSAPPVRSAKT